MPAVRSSPQVTQQHYSKMSKLDLSEFKFTKSDETSPVSSVQDVSEDAQTQNTPIYFPTTPEERKMFRTKEGKRVTDHHWAVYDLTYTIPLGKVTTYKHLCTLLGEGSPRSVGNALRANPFAPYIPCHRVIASDLSLGGFYGERVGPQGKQGKRKVKILASEGINFTERGMLEGGKETVWRGE